MNVFLLEGKYVHYICVANDITEVQKQLEERYKWAKDLKINLGIGLTAHKENTLTFTLTWKEFRHYNYEETSATFSVLGGVVLPEESNLLAFPDCNYH